MKKSTLAAGWVGVVIGLNGCAKDDIAQPMPVGPRETSPGPVAPKPDTQHTPSHTPVTTIPAQANNYVPVTNTSVRTNSTPATPGDEIMATIRGTRVEVRRSQVIDLLLEGYGLNTLMNLTQLEMARTAAREKGISLSAEAIDAERTWTLGKMFTDAEPNEYVQLLERYLTQQRVTRGEFDVVIETNAYLRKLVEPTLTNVADEETLQTMFSVTYGEKVKVRHIALANMQEALDAKSRLAAGEDFSAVARAMSRNPDTQRLGGEVPEFTMIAPNLPSAFKQVAFSLKPGEVSDIVSADGSYHLIKLDRRIAPKAVKYEDMKESLRSELQERLLETAIKELRQNMAATALASLEIRDPVLKAQFEARLKERDNVVRDREAIDRTVRPKPATNPATLPAFLKPNPMTAGLPTTNPMPIVPTTRP